MRWTAPYRLFQTLALLGLLTLPGVAESQTRVTLSGGPAEYDLSGTGWSGTAALHFERSPKPWFRFEAGSGVFWYDTQGDESVVMLLPEVGVAVQAPRPLPIYLAIGIGRSLAVVGRQSDAMTLYGALGLSIPASDRWTVRPEVRFRSIDPFVGGVGGFTLGISRSLGS